MKIRPYRRKSLAARPNEKLAPRFYGPFAVEKKVGPVAYKLSLPATCSIHPVFHVSQLRKANGMFTTITDIPSQLNEELELLVEPEAVIGVRPGIGKNLGGLDVLIQWKGYHPWKPPGNPMICSSNNFLNSTLRTR